MNKAIPYVYSICGLGLVCNFESLLSYCSGILLMLVACLIWMRRQEGMQTQSSDTNKEHA